MMLDPRVLLTDLGLTESEIDVYLALLKGAQSPRDVIRSTGRSRPTVYYALTALERRGLISKTGLEGEQRFRLEPVKRLKTIAQQKLDRLEALQEEVDDFMRQFAVRVKGDSHASVSFYEGVSAVSNVIMETVYAHSRQIDTLVPSRNFFWQQGYDFVEKYVALRKTLGVKTRNLWAEKTDRETLDLYYDKAEIRLLPDGLGERFRSTVFMYDDHVLYISSVASGYALLVRSDEHRELMSAVYGVLWGLGREL